MAVAFRPDIQGLRAIAVGAVVLDHAAVPFLPGGYVGVDVFFVISGFLISSHLLGGLEREGRVRFGEFFARRARRILPASFTVLLLTVAAVLIWVPPLLRTRMLQDAIATALYVPNYAFAIQGTDYLSASTTPSVFQHYWSLGVEEQFYLLWPVLLALVWWIGRRSRRVLAAALAVVVVASFVACVLETAHDQPWAFFSLGTRAWELGAGGLLAVLLQGRGRLLPDAAARIMGWLGLGLIAVAAVAFSARTAFPGYAAAVPVLGAMLVIGAGAAPVRGGVAALLSRRPFQFGGRISYSLYLVHWPILVVPQLVIGSASVLPLWATVGLAAVSVPVAWLLFRLVEDPARRARPLGRARPRRSLLAAGAGAVVLAAVAAGGIAATGLVPLDAGRALARTAPTAPPQASAIVASNLSPSLDAAADDNPALYAEGCEVGYTPSEPHPCGYGTASGPAIVLFGDSHAAQWFPALQRVADAGGERLVTQTKSACASVDVALSWGGSEYASCDAWRAAVIASIRADPPAMVVLANYGNPDLDDPVDGAAQWQRGLESTIRQLADVTQVVVIADTPDLRQNPAVCLSAHLGDASACAPTADFALGDLARDAEVAAAKTTGTRLIDLTDYFCTASACPPIIGNTLVYRDSHHVTATFAAELAPALSRALPPVVRGAG